MVCVKRCWYCVLLVLMVVLVGCAGTPKKAKKTAAPEAVVAAADEAFERITDPYLMQDAKVSKDAQGAFRNALVSMQSEDWSNAQAQLQQLTVSAPELSGPWVNLGIVYQRQQQWPEAEHAFARAVELNAQNGDAYVQWAVMNRELGKFTEAEQLYLKALAVWPHNVDALRNLGILYDLYMGRFDEALKYYELVQKVLPEPSQEIAGWIIDLKRRSGEQ